MRETRLHPPHQRVKSFVWRRLLTHDCPPCADVDDIKAKIIENDEHTVAQIVQTDHEARRSACLFGGSAIIPTPSLATQFRMWSS